uniref:Wall-associated receptor kinase galacturonan-binding domain-containing protein n=1 Tax=Fagus sylvatica TaxID=28930 RepID=A0A2N9IYP4_FAGSY
MNSQLFSWSTTSLVSLFVTTLIFVELPVSLCGDDGYSSCSNNMFNCGAITNVGYPFWGADRPDVCGNPQLLLIWKTTWMDFASPNLVNSTLDSKLFSNVTLMQNLSVVYGCKETPPEIYDYMHIYYENFTCPVYGQGFLTVDDDEPEPCLVTVLVLIPSAISRFNLSQMEGILREGFDVKWKEDSEACSACTRFFKKEG